MHPTDGAAAADPNWVVADMDVLIHQCHSKEAECDVQLARLVSGVAVLNSEIGVVRSQRQETVGTREEAERVREILLSAARAGVALRSGQRQGTARSADAADSGREDTASGADASASPTEKETAGTPPVQESAHAATVDVPAAQLGPRGIQVLQIINDAPSQQWTPKLLVAQLEGQEAVADQKAHNRARAVLDALVKKGFLVKKYQDDNPQRCYFIPVPTEGAV
ncbi:hypothetical protein ACIQZN_25055 [Streptomyces sp. NPDC097595]|uniref:hypothetical protein n=1 Tax=Streptomyces sp. NPDC097595 TaxID=3366090 RepID=UPI00380942A1